MLQGPGKTPSGKILAYVRMPSRNLYQLPRAADQSLEEGKTRNEDTHTGGGKGSACLKGGGGRERERIY